MGGERFAGDLQNVLEAALATLLPQKLRPILRNGLTHS